MQVLTEAERQAIEAAREVVKQFARDELGIEIGHMTTTNGMLMVLYALIKDTIAKRK